MNKEINIALLKDEWEQLLTALSFALGEHPVPGDSDIYYKIITQLREAEKK